jgi:trigger factor
MLEERNRMINTEIKSLSTCRKELNIVMDKEEMEPLREQEIRRVQKEVQIPGFRKGKAPLNLVKRNYAQAIEAYTLEAAIDHALRKSLEQNQIDVVGTPEAKKVDVNEEGKIDITIELDTYPEFEIQTYKGLELNRDTYKIEDSFVDNTIERMRREKATRMSTEDPIEEGHLVILDMQELDNTGVPLVGKKYPDINVRVGEGRFDPELEEQLKGIRAGETKTIEKQYPDDFPQKEFAGKKELYSVTIKKVEKEELPELDEEFFTSLNPEIKTLEDLKKFTRERLEEDYKRQAESRFVQEMSEKLLEENPFEVPQALVDNYLDHIVENTKRQNPKLKDEEIRQHYQFDAEFQIKWHYLKEKLIEAEKIGVGEEDINTFLETLQGDEVRKLYKENEQLMNNVKNEIMDRKIIEFLTENAKIKENEIKLD